MEDVVPEDQSAGMSREELLSDRKIIGLSSTGSSCLLTARVSG
jgi:hypothetical protein